MKIIKMIFLFLYLIWLSSCKNDSNNISFHSLNPPFKEYYIDEIGFENKKCRIDLYAIKGLNKINQDYYCKVDSMVSILENRYKDQYSYCSIEFYDLNNGINLHKKYNYNELRYAISKKQALAWVVFKKIILSTSISLKMAKKSIAILQKKIWMRFMNEREGVRRGSALPK